MFFEVFYDVFYEKPKLFFDAYCKHENEQEASYCYKSYDEEK